MVCLAPLQTIAAQETLSQLLSDFQAERDRASKEAVLMQITTSYPGSGSALLQIARHTQDDETKWLSIRGLGSLKYKPAAPFLKKSLNAKAEYVRSNAARALGEMRDTSATPDLMRLFRTESTDGAMEQTALALEMVGAKKAIPLLESRADYGSSQTRIWTLGAIEVLGTGSEVPFFAGLLDDPDKAVAGLAASAVELLAGQDFGVPKCPPGLCGFSATEEIAKAKEWWAQQAKGDHP